MKLVKFDAPGFLTDFDAAQQEEWHELINSYFNAAVAGKPAEYDGPRAQFFNPVNVDIDADGTELDISWIAFPRNITVSSVGDIQRWRRADSSRDNQDEYCEWSIERSEQTNKITRVTFTCEGPEYWQVLANSSPQKALSLYQQYISPNVRMEDLFGLDGQYKTRNKWNNSTSNGAMHLIQDDNTLGAEIELAGGSSIVRKINGTVLTGAQELIKCGHYGGPNRHSDPFIGEQVNGLARQMADVTLANPIGLYLGGLSTAGWQTPDGASASKFWKYIRGAQGKELRAVFEVTPGHNYTVGDITINGRKIEYGAQIADYISIKLTGLAHRFGKSQAAPFTSCRIAGVGLTAFSIQDKVLAPVLVKRTRV